MAIRLRTWVPKIIWSFPAFPTSKSIRFELISSELIFSTMIRDTNCQINRMRKTLSHQFYLILQLFDDAASAKLRSIFLRIAVKATLSFVSFIDYDIYCSHFFCSHSFQIELSKAKKIIRQWIFMSKAWCIQCFTSWLWRDSAFPGIFPTFCVVRRKKMLSSWICVPSKWFIKSNNRSERLENFQHWEQSHQQNKHSLSHNLSYCRQCEQIKKTRDKMKQNKWEKTYSHRRIWRS